MRGYFGIGIINGKTPTNLGTLWRSAQQLGAGYIFTVGHRYHKQASDTTMAWRHVPLFAFDDFDAFFASLPMEAWLIGIEMGGRDLIGWAHPERAVYLLGAEDHGIPQYALSKCKSVVSIPSIGPASYNVAMAGTIVMYDRLAKK